MNSLKDNKMIPIKINLQELLITLDRVKSAILLGPERSEDVICEITVSADNLQFVVPGAEFEVSCKSFGECKASFCFLHFMQIIESFEIKELILIFSEGFVKIGSFSLPAKTAFLDTISKFRTIQLPINYTDLDLLLLSEIGYTSDEINFYGLSQKVFKAKRIFQENLDEAHKILSMYGVRYKDLNEFVTNIIDKKAKLLKDIYEKQ